MMRRLSARGLLDLLEPALRIAGDSGEGQDS